MGEGGSPPSMAPISSHISNYIYMYVCMYVSMYVCMCVCLCVYKDRYTMHKLCTINNYFALYGTMLNESIDTIQL